MRLNTNKQLYYGFTYTLQKRDLGFTTNVLQIDHGVVIFLSLGREEKRAVSFRVWFYCPVEKDTKIEVVSSVQYVYLKIAF